MNGQASTRRRVDLPKRAAWNLPFPIDADRVAVVSVAWMRRSEAHRRPGQVVMQVLPIGRWAIAVGCEVVFITDPPGDAGA